MTEAKRYEIVRKLAVGGMAEIFLAKQSGVGGFRRHIVLKRILPAHASDRNWVGQFLNEAALAAALNHPNIVQVYDVGRHRDSYIMAMEYIDGSDLETLLKAHRDVGTYMPLRVALTYLSDVLCALDYAHDACDIDGKPLGLIHRDISTSNIMVTSEGQAKILDFGIAKMFEQPNDVEKTQVGVVRGKASCLAPEQIRGTGIDRRVDVHACGVLLYELLTNQNPFKVPDQVQTLRNVIDLVPEIPELRAQDVPEPIRYVMAKALAKNRDERFPTCGTMLAALEGAMERCGYGASRTAARNYMRGTTHDTASTATEKQQDERTENEMEAPGEEKTKNVRRPTTLKPIAELKEPPLPLAPIAPTSLSLFELDDMVTEDPDDSDRVDPAKPLQAQHFAMPVSTFVGKIPHWHRAAKVWPAVMAAVSFFVLTSFHAWQPAAAEAPTLPPEAPVAAADPEPLPIATPPPAPPEPQDDAKKAKKAPKRKRH